MKKKLLAFLMMFFMLLLFAPVTAQPGDSSDDKTTTVIDQAGRTVEVGEVETVAVCWYMADDFVLAMGLGDKLVAIGPYDDFHVLVKPDIPELDTVGRGRPDMEKLASVNPGLFIHTVADQDNVEAVEALGLAMIQIDPETIEKTLDAYKLVGQATGTYDRALMLEEIYYDITNEAEEIIGDIAQEDRPSFVILGADPGKIADGKMMQAVMITNGGGVNVAAEKEGDGFWPEVGVEQVFVWDPEYIFISQTADYSVQDIINDPTWSDLQAVKDNKVFKIPGSLHNWENPGMGTALGTLWAAKTFFPGAYSDEKFDGTAKEFYKRIYNIDVSSEIIGY